MSFHVKYKPEDFMPANEEEKQSQVIMRESVGFWQDGFRRLRILAHSSGSLGSALGAAEDFVKIRLPWSASSLLL